MPFFLPFFITVYGLIRAGFSAFKDKEFRALAFLLFILFMSGMVFYHEVEGWRWLDSLYFSVMTLTTVGYGDFSPHYDSSKIFTMVYILIGLGIVFGFVEHLAKHTRENRGPSLSRMTEMAGEGVSRMRDRWRNRNDESPTPDT